MNPKVNFNTLTAKYFIVALIVMLVNDLYLKSAFSNMLTGKLSDFAWLFVVPFFLSTFSPRFAKEIYLFSGLFFIFWKLEISESFIQFISKLTHTGFYRTVDATDLVALIILPFSYNYFAKKVNERMQSNFVINSILGVVFCFAMMADKQPRERYEDELITQIETKSEDYKVDINKKYVVKLNNTDAFFDEKGLNTESEASISFEIPKYNATIQANAVFEKKTNGYMNIILKNIESIQITDTVDYNTNMSICKGLRSKDYEKLFRENVIEEIIKNGTLESDTFSIVWD
ncbi:MAG: hypothetical protein QM535_11940 [Limnohabitans sp.]|nr:hypothetical protein [Limnohabitans sp.]